VKIPLSAPTAVGAGALLCALILAGCSQPQTTPSAADAPSTVVGEAQNSDPANGPDALAAARSASPFAEIAQTQVSRDVEDNTRSRALALELGAHPDRLTRQSAICGPGNTVLQARYAALKGPAPEDLRDLKVACTAKDIAERSARDGAGGGVKNTSLL
jgi:hypothetical protein